MSNPQPAPAASDTPLQAALIAYENARMDGLCHEGAWECALEAARHGPNQTSLDPAHLLAALQRQWKR